MKHLIFSILSVFFILSNSIATEPPKVDRNLTNNVKERKKRMSMPIYRQPIYPYITGDAFRDHSDFIYDHHNQDMDPKKVQQGDIIFVNTYMLNKFIQNVHPKIVNKYILITHNGDVNITRGHLNIINDEKIIVWFSDNVLIKHKKLIPIPLGLQNRYTVKGSETTGRDYMKRKNEFPKKHFVYVNFRIWTNSRDRTKAYNIFKNKPYCTVSDPVPYEKYLEDIISSEFVISPPGNVFDCHRTWESIYLGAIPVILSTASDPLFEDLPVIIVKNWNQVTPEFLKAKHAEFSKRQFNMDKMYLDYWFNIIDSYKAKHHE